jgi:GDPmannose 4,6-dehydratase
MFVSNGILFKHESPRRGLEFVTRKTTDGAARIATGKTQTLTLGNLEACRDWGYAPEYVDLMWRIVQAKEPAYVVGATGQSHTVPEFAQAAFESAGVEDWEKCFHTDVRFNRLSEVFSLRGNPGRAKRELGWEPKMRFPELLGIMVAADLERHRQTAK